jgi:hypothetical protein
MGALAKSQPGSLVVGFQVRTNDPKQAYWGEPTKEGEMKFHTLQTFETFWNEVREKTGTRWEVNAVLREWEEFGQNEKETM